MLCVTQAKEYGMKHAHKRPRHYPTSAGVVGAGHAVGRSQLQARASRKGMMLMKNMRLIYKERLEGY